MEQANYVLVLTSGKMEKKVEKKHITIIKYQKYNKLIFVVAEIREKIHQKLDKEISKLMHSGTVETPEFLLHVRIRLPRE
jgi:hypothetical protein